MSLVNKHGGEKKEMKKKNKTKNAAVIPVDAVTGYLCLEMAGGGGGYCKGAIYIVGCVGKVDLSLMAKPD